MCWFTQARAGLQSLGKQETTLQSTSWVQSVSSQWQGCSQAVGTCVGWGEAASQWKPSESQVICMVEQVLAESPKQSMNPSGNRLLVHRAGRWHRLLRLQGHQDNPWLGQNSIRCPIHTLLIHQPNQQDSPFLPSCSSSALG